MKRKQFFKILSMSLAIPAYYLWDSVVDKKRSNDAAKNPLTLKNDFPSGITIIDSVIINKSAEGLKIFSSKCSHLGCRINKAEDNEIICPCHGSRYSFSGEVIKGPSTKPLKELNYTIDSENGNIIIYPA